MSQSTRVSFLVRVSLDQAGEVRGVIERVATGAKEPFTGADAIGPAIARMLPPPPARPPAGTDALPDTARPPAPIAEPALRPPQTAAVGDRPA